MSWHVEWVYACRDRRRVRMGAEERKQSRASARVEKARKETLLQRTRSDSLAFFTFGESGRESKVTQEHAQHHASAHTAPSLLHTRAFFCVSERAWRGTCGRETSAHPARPTPALLYSQRVAPALPRRSNTLLHAHRGAKRRPWNPVSRVLHVLPQKTTRLPYKTHTHTHQFVFS